MINELLPADAVLPLKSWTRTARTYKKGTKVFDKKLEEMKKQLASMFKCMDDVERMHEEVGAFYTRLNTDGNCEMMFFECEGQRQVESMIFFPSLSPGAIIMSIALFNTVTKLPSFSVDSLMPTGSKTKNNLIFKLLDLLGTRAELQVQRAALFLLLTVCEMIKDGSTVLQALSNFAAEHTGRLHPLATIVDVMVSHRDGLFVGYGLKLINLLIRWADAAGQLDSLSAELENTLFHRVVMQFTLSPSAQQLEEVAQELKKFQGWVLRDAKKRLGEKFSLSDPEHRKMLVSYWNLRHASVACPVREDSAGYNEETKDLWMDLGFFNDPLTYLTCVMRMHDLYYFASTRTANWMGLLDKLSATRKMQERAKGAVIGKVDYDVVAVSVGLTTRMVDLVTSSASVIPAQQILWQDSGRLALFAAGMEMARTVFTSYK
jgi:hypothetical protein